MSFRPNWYDEPPRRRGPSFLGHHRTWGGLKTIVIVTTAFYLAQKVAGWVPGDFSRWFSDTLGMRTHSFSDGKLELNLFLPIQLFTYPLVHASFGHIFWNMVLLFIYGQFVEPQMGKKSFLRLYFGGAVLGGLAQAVVGFTEPSPVPTVGASAAVYAVMVLTTCRYPHQRLMLIIPPIPMPLWLLLAMRIFFDINALASGQSGSVAVAAHLGGALFGFLWFRRGDVVGKAVEGHKRRKHAKELEVASTDRREMDRILAKIQESGLSSLSAEERRFLERRSKELRKEQT